MLDRLPLPAIDFNGPGLLPERVQPYAKAVYPFVSSLVVSGVLWVTTGTYDDTNLTLNLTGIGMAFLTFLVPNGAAVHVHGADSLEDDSTTTLDTPMDEWDPDAAPEPHPDSAAAQIQALGSTVEPAPTADTDLHNHVGGPPSPEPLPPPQEGEGGHAGTGDGE